MIKFVQKRDGRIVAFEKEKIINAILKAGNATHEFGRDTAEFLTNIVCIEINETKVEPLNIEVIQNKIEEVLMRKGFYQTAKAFILYREKRRELREFKNHLNVLELFESYIGESTWEVHENANIDYSIQGLKSFITGKAESIYWLEKVYPKKISQYHKDGFVHIHNLSFLGAYCVGWDLEDLIRRGFGGVPGKPYSTPAKHLSSLLGQMMNFLFTLQNEAAGAVAFSSFDTYLAPFVYYDKLTYKEVKQQIQEFVYNMNQTMRTGGQSPFSNITVDLTPHPLLKDRPVIVAGKEQDITYGMLQKEMDMINKALFETFIEGDGHGRPFTFPIPTINITKDFDWDNPVLSPVWEATAKYGTPYFANYINSDLKPEDARSMCCRLKLDTRELKNKGGGGLFGSAPLTGSVGVITVNLPRIAYLSKKNINEFYNMLDDILVAAKEGLEEKRKTVEKFTEMGLYPYSKIYLEPIKESFGHYWENHFNTIGIIGMNEALQMLFDPEVDMGTQKGIDFAVQTMLHIREKLKQFQEETGHLFNLEATPSESTAYSLALKDKKDFKNIITAGTPDNPYYTNSTILPVNYTDDPFEVAALQEPTQRLYTGGCVVHFFVGERLKSNDVKTFVRKILSNFELPYITVTPTFSICPKHGYIPGEHEYCPYCDEELIEKTKRGEVSKKVDIKIDLKL